MLGFGRAKSLAERMDLASRVHKEVVDVLDRSFYRSQKPICTTVFSGRMPSCWQRQQSLQLSNHCKILLNIPLHGNAMIQRSLYDLQKESKVVT